MTVLKINENTHPAELELAGLLSGGLKKIDRERIEKHLSSCDECMNAMVAAYESVSSHNKKTPSKIRKGSGMKKTRPNIYLLLAIISFSLSFAAPRYFIQLLVATLLLGIKWIADAKSTKMLVMIYEAWKHGGEKEASRVLERMEQRTGVRL